MPAGGLPQSYIYKRSPPPKPFVPETRPFTPYACACRPAASKPRAAVAQHRAAGDPRGEKNTKASSHAHAQVPLPAVELSVRLVLLRGARLGQHQRPHWRARRGLDQHCVCALCPRCHQQDSRLQLQADHDAGAPRCVHTTRMRAPCSFNACRDQFVLCLTHDAIVRLQFPEQ